AVRKRVLRDVVQGVAVGELCLPQACNCSDVGRSFSLAVRTCFMEQVCNISQEMSSGQDCEHFHSTPTPNKERPFLPVAFQPRGGMGGLLIYLGYQADKILVKTRSIV